MLHSLMSLASRDKHATLLYQNPQGWHEPCEGPVLRIPYLKAWSGHANLTVGLVVMAPCLQI